MTKRFRLGLLGLLAATAVVLGAMFVSPGPAAVRAQTGGTVTGRVLWCAAVPSPLGFPGVAGGTGTGSSEPGIAPAVPATPAVPTTPRAAGPQTIPGRPAPVPVGPRLIPAGGVLVAVQGTALSARSAEDGSFTIDGVPVGEYVTVAAGPVANITGAVALRPNVHITPGAAAVDVGTLTIGTPCRYVFPAPAPAASPAPSPQGQ